MISRNDLSSLRPRRPTDTSGEAPFDFLVKDEKTDQLIFGIENKTGRSSIADMSKFQLDLSDCDSILYHVRELKIPAYIIHAQVLEIWTPPTMGYYTVGLWWTDIYRMAEQFMSVSMRRMEMRGAAYFKKSAFFTIDTLANDLYNDNGNLRLVEKFRQEGIPKMYIND